VVFDDELIKGTQDRDHIVLRKPLQNLDTFAGQVRHKAERVAEFSKVEERKGECVADVYISQRQLTDVAAAVAHAVFKFDRYWHVALQSVVNLPSGQRGHRRVQ